MSWWLQLGQVTFLEVGIRNHFVFLVIVYGCTTMFHGDYQHNQFRHSHLGMDQNLLIPFLVGWTSIYQLFWCSPGVQGFDTLPFDNFNLLGRCQKAPTHEVDETTGRRIFLAPWLRVRRAFCSDVLGALHRFHLQTPTSSIILYFFPEYTVWVNKHSIPFWWHHQIALKYPEVISCFISPCNSFSLSLLVYVYIYTCIYIYIYIYMIKYIMHRLHSYIISDLS